MDDRGIIDDPSGTPADLAKVQEWWRQFRQALAEDGTPDQGTAVRHLVMDSSATTPDQHLVQAFCGNEPLPYERARFTYLTGLATCTDCLAVHAAWLVAGAGR